MTSVSQKVLMFDLVLNRLMNAFSGSKFFILQFSGLIFRQFASDMTHSTLTLTSFSTNSTFSLKYFLYLFQ